VDRRSASIRISTLSEQSLWHPRNFYLPVRDNPAFRQASRPTSSFLPSGVPVLGREVVEGKQRIAIFDQTLDRLLALWQLVQNIGGLVYPGVVEEVYNGGL
jgi:hypothetical protein